VEFRGLKQKGWPSSATRSYSYGNKKKDGKPIKLGPGRQNANRKELFRTLLDNEEGGNQRLYLALDSEF